MLQIFQEEWIVTIFMMAFFGLSIFLRVLLGTLYRNMIKEADNMAITKNKLLKQCKLKFANCYQLNNGVANIPVFVDKFLNRLALGPFSFETMYHLSGQTMLLSVVSAGVGICRSILNGKMLGEILPFYIVSFIGLYVYFSVSTVVDVKGKRRILKINLVDYLENHLSSRINVTDNDMEMLFGAQRLSGRDRRQRIAGNTGRRTVELMPIGGGQIAAGGEQTIAGNVAGRGQMISGGGQMISGRGQMISEGGQMISGGGQIMTGGMAGDGQITAASALSDSSIKVSEEELEALLREFLAT